MAEEDRRSARREEADRYRVEHLTLRQTIRDLRTQLKAAEKQSEKDLLGLAHSITEREQYAEVQHWKNRRQIKKMWASEVKRSLEPVLANLKEQRDLVNVQHFGLVRLEAENMKLKKTLELQRDLNTRLMEKLRDERKV